MNDETTDRTGDDAAAAGACPGGEHRACETSGTPGQRPDEEPGASCGACGARSPRAPAPGPEPGVRRADLDAAASRLAEVTRERDAAREEVARTNAVALVTAKTRDDARAVLRATETALYTAASAGIAASAWARRWHEGARAMSARARAMAARADLHERRAAELTAERADARATGERAMAAGLAACDALRAELAAAQAVALDLDATPRERDENHRALAKNQDDEIARLRAAVDATRERLRIAAARFVAADRDAVDLRRDYVAACAAFSGALAALEATDGR